MPGFSSVRIFPTCRIDGTGEGYAVFGCYRAGSCGSGRMWLEMRSVVAKAKNKKQKQIVHGMK